MNQRKRQMITVNKLKVSNEIEPEITIDQLLDFILNDEKLNEHEITKVILDGKRVVAEDEKEQLSTQVGRYQSIEVFHQSRKAIAYDVLSTCPKYIDNIIFKIDEIIDAYDQNNLNEATRIFCETLDFIDLFVKLFTNLNKTLKPLVLKDVEFNENLQRLELHLLSVMKSLIPAKEKNDIIMLCDLLQYELVDNLTQWKMKIIPDYKAKTIGKV